MHWKDLVKYQLLNIRRTLTLPILFYMNFHMWKTYVVTTLALGSQPRQGLTRLRAQREARGSHLMFPGVQKSVREWTLTLPSELPFWELESQWTPESSEGNYKGWNPLDWRVLYIIEKLLKRRCLKWAHMTHLDIWNTSYGRQGVKLTVWLPTTKSQESTQFPYVQV
jgi:hypothetical protein